MSDHFDQSRQPTPFHQNLYESRTKFSRRPLKSFCDNDFGGVPLGPILKGTYSVPRPELLDEPFVLRGPDMLDAKTTKPTLFLHFFGYKPYANQIYVVEGSSRKAITMRRLLDTLAREVKAAIESAERENCEFSGMDVGPPFITIENVLLTELVQVDKARIQPTLKLFN